MSTSIKFHLINTEKASQSGTYIQAQDRMFFWAGTGLALLYAIQVYQ
jgi:hypothetical protein